ncbi:GspH/FimT family pseudopilin [Tardiphaga robiniae]|uniref:Type II secretion system protein H n=1 Tax=Tardiphaga robiniae TaxID=943830 RepID=A0A7G6U8F1_9BRAD|nr:GspH/FimT family pseudopilin [Tardiphaga robiniae]QND75283.1 prepilin-type N-terminal cleavage/methylation domain-containing protein [Tardiphaga robiniae]
MKRCSRASAGFTILEMLVVLGIMGLSLAAMVMARPDSSGARVNVAARSVAATLRLARARAIERNTDMLVVVDTDQATVGFSGAARPLPRGVRVALTVAASERNGGQGGLRFYPDGQSTGGDIELRIDNRVARVAVDWLTGEPRVQP